MNDTNNFTSLNHLTPTTCFQSSLDALDAFFVSTELKQEGQERINLRNMKRPVADQLGGYNHLAQPTGPKS